MPDTLNIFGTEYTNVAGIIAKDDLGNDLTFTRGGSGGGTPVGIIASGGTITVDTARYGVLTIPHGLGKVPLAMCLWPVTNMTNSTGTYAPAGGFATFAESYKGNIFPSTVVIQNSSTLGNGSFGLYVANNGNMLRPSTESYTMGSTGSYFRTPDATNLYYAVNQDDGLFPAGMTYGWWAVAESDEGGGGGEPVLIEKTITQNGTYAASSDSADGYSSVTVSVSGGTPRTSTDLTVSGATVTAPAGVYAQDASKSVATGTAGTPTATKGTVSNHSVSVTPSVTNVTGYITGGTKTGTAVTVTAAELESGTKSITANGTGIDVSGYSAVDVAVPSGGSKNVQTTQSTSRRNNTALGSITSLTCSTAGTYDVYWTCARSNTSQTWGSQLYIGGTAYGTENTTWSNNVQNNHLTGVSISANQTVAVYGRSRSGYYIYAPQLTIVQTA